jgi:hypothetical protein
LKSFNSEAIVSPRPVKKIAIRNMKINPRKRLPILWILNPSKYVMLSTIKPWIIAMIAPPRVFPIIIYVLEIGATRVSLGKPNRRSQITSRPEKTAVKRIAMAIIPGVRKSV